MTIVPVESGRFELMEKVVDLWSESKTELQIARELGIQRKVVLELLGDYRAALATDPMARDMARDHLAKLITHYDKLIRKFYSLVRDLEDINFNHQVAGQINAALKAIAELEARRLDLIQKAGLLESGDLGDELAAMEEKQDIVMDILRNDLCTDCKQKVAYKLSQISGKAEVISSEVVDV